MRVKVKIKRLDKSLPLPKYQTKGAAGFDFYLREPLVLEPGEFCYAPTGVAMKIPKGHFLLVNSRGSTFNKYKLLVIPGVGDEDFCGDNDEYLIQVVNLGKKTVRLEKGTRIAQGVLVKISTAKFWEVGRLGKGRQNDIEDQSRGGFGTTGN